MREIRWNNFKRNDNLLSFLNWLARKERANQTNIMMPIFF